VVGATMPKTAPHLDCHSGRPEQDINSASHAWYRSGTDPVAKAESMKRSA